MMPPSAVAAVPSTLIDWVAAGPCFTGTTNGERSEVRMSAAPTISRAIARVNWVIWALSRSRADVRLALPLTTVVSAFVAEAEIWSMFWLNFAALCFIGWSNWSTLASSSTTTRSASMPRPYGALKSVCRFAA
jgi:hypothetical protein